MSIFENFITASKNFFITIFSKKPEDIKVAKRNRLISVFSLALLIFIILFIMTLTGVFLPADYKKVLLGERMLSQEQFSKAEQAFLEAVGINERQNDASNDGLIRTYDTWTISLISKEVYSDETLSLLEKLINKNSLNSIYYLRQANVFNKLERYTDAEESCKKALQTDLKNEEAYNLYANLRILADDTLQAVAILKQGIENTGSASLLTFHDTLIPKAPKFSMMSGSYDHYLTLEINNSNEDCQVLYTLNGSDPNPTEASVTIEQTISQSENTTTTSNISLRYYKEPLDFEELPEDGKVIVRSVCIDKNGITSYETNAEYIFNVSFVALKSFNLSETEIVLTEGEELSLIPSIAPLKATNRKVIWTSSDTNFAVVDENGVVKAVKYTENVDKLIRLLESAEVVITATVEGGEGFSAETKVTVLPFIIKPEEVDLEKMEFLKRDILADYNINSDIVGWFYFSGPELVRGAPIDKSIVQTTDNSFYLNNDIYKKPSEDGWIVADYECDMENLSRNTILFGHARSYVVFGGIKRLDVYPFWYNDANNHFIRVNTLYGEYIFQAFSWYVTTVEFKYLRNDFKDDKDYLDYLNLIQSKKPITESAKV